jgi:hypothetical protein
MRTGGEVLTSAGFETLPTFCVLCCAPFSLHYFFIECGKTSKEPRRGQVVQGRKFCQDIRHVSRRTQFPRLCQDFLYRLRQFVAHAQEVGVVDLLEHDAKQVGKAAHFRHLE